MPITLNLRTEEAKQAVRTAIFQGTQQVFRNKILPEAKRRSPREPQRHEGQPHNADTLAIRVSRTRKGVRASIFSQSGHGYYLEVGTRRQPAQPYIKPSVQANVSAIPAAIKEQLEGSK